MDRDNIRSSGYAKAMQAINTLKASVDIKQKANAQLQLKALLANATSMEEKQQIGAAMVSAGYRFDESGALLYNQGGDWIDSDFVRFSNMGNSRAAKSDNDWATYNQMWSDRNNPKPSMTIKGQSPLMDDDVGGLGPGSGMNSSPGQSTAITDPSQVPGYQTGGNIPGGTADSGSFGDGKDYSGSWFGGVDPLAMDQMNDPGNAWGYYTAKGNNGGDFYGTGMERYGKDDFNSAMTLSSILSPSVSSGGTLTPQDKLSFTGDWMSGTSAGGYKDPGKILQAAFANAAQATDTYTQEDIITQAIDAIAPYMDKTAYDAMTRRVSQILNTYGAEGMQQGSTSDNRNGKLLQMVMAAVGMG